ncbi:hypothetical protein [Falsiroseomonas sp.]|uniref:hypothetical protein n=1 Tax=Falsiroseomonas sp. TaxID=2870721 RepID=UPI002735D1B9|nr:hypothetical protein [Falsiroseomonas sp.]MDP3417894.1 hypothetical protein [Falsiroseomonas sp.]
MHVEEWVRVELDDVLEDVGDDVLRQECARRGIALAPSIDGPEDMRDLAEAVRRAAERGDLMDLDVQLRALMDAAGVPRLRIPGRAADEARTS